MADTIKFDITKYSSLVVTYDSNDPVEIPVNNGSAVLNDNIIISSTSDGTLDISAAPSLENETRYADEHHKISITGKKQNIKKLDKKFLDDTDIKKYVNSGLDACYQEIDTINSNIVGGKGTGDSSDVFNVGDSNSNTASGNYSHAEGEETKASGRGSHSEGYQTSAKGGYSHAEGYFSEASGDNSHSEGSTSIALGRSSHAEGEHTKAYGGCQHVFGYSNNPLPNTYDKDALDSYFGFVASGTYKIGDYAYYGKKLYRCIGNRSLNNTPDTDSAWREATDDDEAIEIAGNGNGGNSSNARVLYRSGREWLAGPIEPVGGVILKSTTANSTKRFLVTVDDTGALKATEITA